jgi:phosphoserine aminotransferase
MKLPQKPVIRPNNPRFSSGPCAKYPGWSVNDLKDAFLGRSHRHMTGKEKLKEVITRTRDILEIPDSHYIAIVPGSDTGAMEMAMWSMLGARGAELLAWDSFGLTWAADVTDHLKIPNTRLIRTSYGELPDLTQVNFSHDVIFTWNGTTSGVCVPDGEWIDADREGLTFCDATSAAFAVELAWDKLDVTTWSWQKVMGGEAAHGMLVLGPRAIERLESYTPPWPLPKVFRLTKNKKLDKPLFEGITINTPSMLCVEDAINSLKWAESIGGLKGMMDRIQANSKATFNWVETSPWVDFLAQNPSERSNTSVTLIITDPWLKKQDEETRHNIGRSLSSILDAQGAGYDVANHLAAPPGLRLWNGATVETSDLEALFPWLDWGWSVLKAKLDQSEEYFLMTNHG